MYSLDSIIIIYIQHYHYSKSPLKPLTPHFPLQTRGTNLEGGGGVGIGDPDHVLITISEPLIINLTYSGRRKEKLWTEL